MLVIFLFHSNRCEFKLILSALNLLLVLEQSLRIGLIFLLGQIKLVFHFLLFLLYSGFLLELTLFGFALLGLVLLLGLLELLQHGRLLLFKLLLLDFVAFLCNSGLLCVFSILNFIKSHIPVNCLLVFKLLISRVVSNCHSFRTIGFHTIKPILLDELPGKFFLVFASQLLTLVLNLFRNFDQLFESTAKLRILKNINAASEGDSITVIQDALPLLNAH